MTKKLSKESKPFIRDMNDLKQKLGYDGYKKKNPHKDGTLQGKSSIGDVKIVANRTRHVKHTKGKLTDTKRAPGKQIKRKSSG